MIFLPKEKSFLKLFEAQSKKISQAVALLEKLKKDYSKLSKIEREVDRLEDEADGLVHKIINELLYDHTRVTEEKGDIRYFISNMDNIIDALEKTINRLKIYHIPELPQVVKEFLPLLKQASVEIQKGVWCLSNLRKYDKVLSQCCVKINTLEEKADAVNRKWLQRIITSEAKDLKEVSRKIALKEIVDLLEYTMDQCEDVSNIFDTFRLKGQV